MHACLLVVHAVSRKKTSILHHVIITSTRQSVIYLNYSYKLTIYNYSINVITGEIHGELTNNDTRHILA